MADPIVISYGTRTLTVESSEDPGIMSVWTLVSRYGATGDGVTDDTASINAAIADLSPGGMLVFGPGTYVCSGLVFAGLWGVKVIGSGNPGTVDSTGTMLAITQPAGSLFTVRGCGWCSFEGFAIKDNGGTATVGIDYTSTGTASQRCEFRNISVRGPTSGIGVRVGPPTGDTHQVDTSVFDNVSVYSADVGFYQYGTQSVGNRYHECVAAYCVTSGMDFAHGDVRMDGCKFLPTAGATATADVVVEDTALWAAIRDNYHESRNGPAYSFPGPSTARRYPTLMSGVRVQWEQADDATMVDYQQDGPLVLESCTFSGLNPAGNGGKVDVIVPAGGTPQDITVVGCLFGNDCYLSVSGDCRLLGDSTASSGHRQVIDGWYMDNVAANHNNDELSRLAGAAVAGRVKMVRAGSATGIAVSSTEARTAGSLVVRVAKYTALGGYAGTAVLATLDGTNPQNMAATFHWNVAQFAAGDWLNVEVSTSADWAPITADIRASIEVET